MSDKKTKGKQKIEMKRVENDNDRMITFSKRKSGIHKKLNELISTCNVEAAFLAFSRPGTPFTFTHPSMEDVVDRFMNPNYHPPRDGARMVAEAYRKQNINKLIRDYEKFEEELAMEKEREKDLGKFASKNELEKYWWKVPIEELNEDEAQKTYDTYVELQNTLCDMVNERSRLSGEASSSGVKQSVGPQDVDDETNPSLSIPLGGIRENKNN